MNGMRSHTRRVIVGSLMRWLDPLVTLAQSENPPVQEWANQVLERMIYSHREMRQQVQSNGFAVLRCLALAPHARGAQQAAASALASILEEGTGQQADVVKGLGMHAVLSLAASSDDQAWAYTVLAVTSLQSSGTQLVLSSEDLQSQSSLANHEADETEKTFGGDNCSCLPLLVQLVHGDPAYTYSGRSVEDTYRMQSFCVHILARAAATEGFQHVLVDAGATAALISAARLWLRQFGRAPSPTQDDPDTVDQDEDVVDCTPVQMDDIVVAVLAIANLAETAGFAERTFVHCDQEDVNESGLDGLLGLIQVMLVMAHGTQAAAKLRPHATRILASLAHSAQESGYIGSWIIGAIFDKGLLLPLERIIREECLQEAGPVHPDLMRYVASSLAELAKAHGTPMYSQSGTATPLGANTDALPPSICPSNSGTLLLARGSSSGLSNGLMRGNSGLSDLEDGPNGSMSSLKESLSNLSEIVTGSARSLGSLLPTFPVPGSGSFRAEGWQNDNMCAGRRFSSVCADEPAAMLPRVVQECQRSGVSAGWIARLARNADPDVQRCAALIYSSISGTAQSWLTSDDDDNKLNELAKVLLVLAATDSVETRKAAKMTIVALAKFSEEYRTALVDHATTLKPVLLLLTKSVVDMHVDKRGDLLSEQRLAASILRYIIGSAACRERVMHGPLSDVVASVLRLHDDVEISTQMSFVFANISSDPETKEKLDSEFIGALQHMMNDDDSQSQTVQMNAVAAVRHVASEARLQSLLLSMGIVPVLVRLASSQSADVRTDAVQALTALSPLLVSDPAVAMVNTAGGLTRQTSEGSESGTDIGLDGGITDIKESQVEIHSSLGKGAYGEVFRGRWRGSDVAIKCMSKRRGGINDDPKAVDRELNREFRNEVHLLMQARHPNIVLLMGTMASSRRLCIVSELCHRGSLYRVLHQTTASAGRGDDRPRSLKPLPPWSKRLQMMHDAASGCHFLHSSEPCIVHLDLKSPNLLVDKNWNVKVADFGLARLKQHFYVDTTGPVGTPEWTAPEVLKSEPFNESADVYSFGVVLWEMATRSKPFAGIPGHVVVAKVISGQKLKRPTEEQTGGALPDGYTELMYACMSAQWQDRPEFDGIRSRLLEIHNSVHASESAARAARGGHNPKTRAPENDARRVALQAVAPLQPPRQVDEHAPASAAEPTPAPAPRD